MFTEDELKKIMEYSSDVTTSAMKLHHAVLKSDGAVCYDGDEKEISKRDYLSAILNEASIATEVYRKASNMFERMNFAPPTGYQVVAVNRVCRV